MPSPDWYRRKTWSGEDRAEFEEKLSRARGQRSEYLRIQSNTLATTREAANAPAAIELADRYLSENPASVFRAEVYVTIARGFTTIGEIDRAIKAYRSAAEVERTTPQIHGCVYIEFAWFAATRGLSAVYEEVMDWMETNMHKTDLAFPLNQYCYFGALALISSDLGNLENARRMATNALGAADKDKGPFERHPDLGVVPRERDDAYERIRALAR